MHLAETRKPGSSATGTHNWRPADRLNGCPAGQLADTQLSVSEHLAHPEVIRSPRLSADCFALLDWWKTDGRSRKFGRNCALYLSEHLEQLGRLCRAASVGKQSKLLSSRA